MRIVTKRIKVIQMTEEEVAKFHEAMQRASEGHTSHYAEEKLDDGSYLGVSVVKAHEPLNRRDIHERASERY
jgi:hypothetical protein